MVTRPRASLVVGLSLCAIWLPSSDPQAWEIVTHQAITDAAAESSQVTAVLQDTLGVLNGLGFIASDGVSRRLHDWLREGAGREDDAYHWSSNLNPYGRFLNHFHHPLRAWSAAGLNDLVTGQSSVLWGQTDSQNHRDTGNWSWQELRRQFELALTGEQQTKREAALARTFSGLGHQLHLVQDAASVPHARNRAHPVGDNIEKATERFQTRRPQEFTQMLAQTPRILPRPQLLTKDANPLAAIPIARFIDADEYAGVTADFTATLDDATDSAGNPIRLSPVGLAEYTNANFVSQKTILTGDTLASTHKWWSPYPKRSSTDLDLLQQSGKLPEFITAEDQQVDSTFYISKIADGERIPRFLKPTYAATVFGERGLSLQAIDTWQLDDRIHEDYARRLLPRAVGYSTALLDYFFRGKLDIDLVGPDAVGLYQLTGTNQSPEALVEGTLTLYADDPATGVRTPLEAATNIPISGVRSGDPVFAAVTPSPSFAIPDADRFVAVYQGTLGNEVKNDASNFPGAVIGKVLGGVRVEEVFADADSRWKLRTPTGIFPLSQQTGTPEAPVLVPLTTATFEWLKWGDAENLLVGLTWATEPPVLLVAFAMPRRANSVEPQTVDTQEGPTVPLTITQSSAFPFGLTLGTTVTLHHQLHYRQPLVKVEQIQKHLWQPEWVDAGGVAHPGYYYLDGEEYPPPQVLTPVDDTLTFDASVELTLSAAQSPWGPEWSPYFWAIEDIGVDATGTRLLALIWAMPNTWDGDVPPPQTRPVYGLSPNGSLQQTGTVSLSGGLPQEIWLWALIDVTSGRVLATTAPEQVTFATEAYADALPGPSVYSPSCGTSPGYWRQPIDRYIGGPTPHDEPHSWEAVALASRGCIANPIILPDRVTEVGHREGTAQAHLIWLRPALAATFADPAQLDFTTEVTYRAQGDYLYWCGSGYCTLRLTGEWADVREYPVDLEMVRRACPASPAGERLVLLPMGRIYPGDTVPLVVVTTGPTLESAQVAAPVQFPAREIRWKSVGAYLFPPLVDVTGDGALVTGDYPYWPDTVLNGYVVTLDGTTPLLTVPNVDFRGTSMLFPPRFVYNTEAQRFYRLTPPMGLTALPRRLAPSGAADGASWYHDYHLVRLP